MSYLSALSNVCKKAYQIANKIDTNKETATYRSALDLDVLTYANDFLEDIPIERLSFQICVAACESGDLELLKDIMKIHPKWDPLITVHAAKNGQLHILKYAHENGCPWHKGATGNAAYYKQFECLQYAHENGCPWDETTTSLIVAGGGLFYSSCIEYLKYVTENGCPWDSTVMLIAAQLGLINLMQYCHENGCPWHLDTVWTAIYYNNLNILKYCYENGCPGSKLSEILEYTTFPGDSPMKTYILEYMSN